MERELLSLYRKWGLDVRLTSPTHACDRSGLVASHPLLACLRGQGCTPLWPDQELPRMSLAGSFQRERRKAGALKLGGQHAASADPGLAHIGMSVVLANGMSVVLANGTRHLTYILPSVMLANGFPGCRFQSRGGI